MVTEDLPDVCLVVEEWIILQIKLPFSTVSAFSVSHFQGPPTPEFNAYCVLCAQSVQKNTHQVPSLRCLAFDGGND